MARTDVVPPNLLKAFGLCLLAYILALAAAINLDRVLQNMHPIVVALLGDITATLVIYIFSRVFRNSSFYDPYWSVAPLVIVFYWTIAAMPASGIGFRQIVILSLVFIWGLRLTFNFARQWRGLLHEDWRYSEYRNRYQGWFWLIDLVGIELMPTVIVFLGCLSVYPVLAGGGPFFSFLDIAALSITFGAVLVETVADRQLNQFLSKHFHTGEIMKRGLWAYSRHPNYFGEILFWWGLYLFALSTNPHYWWTIIGPLAVTLLFLIVSVPLMDKRSLARRPGYA